MPYLYVHHKVADYNQWRKVFDSLDGVRRARGFIEANVYQNNSDPHDVVVLESWNSLDGARGWGESPELRAAMEEAGAIFPPVILYLETAWGVDGMDGFVKTAKGSHLW